MRPGRAPRILAGLLLAAAACGGGQAAIPRFSTDWTDDAGSSIDRVWQRIGAAPIPPSADLVVGVVGQDDKMIGLPLGEDTKKWTFSHPLDTRPSVTGGVVVGSGAGEVFALDAASGTLLWKTPTPDLVLLGAGDDGAVTVLSFQAANRTLRHLMAVGRDGKIVLSMDTDKALGTPAVVARLVFVPWAGQYVSVLDLDHRADEIARVTLREETTRAWTESGALWFGELGFVRFDSRIREASRGRASTLLVRTGELPGEPKLMPSGASHVAADANAADEVRAYARPEGAAEGASLADGRLYATYFRLALGVKPGAKNEVAWVHLHPRSFLAGGAEEGGIVLCDDQGNVTELDARTGGTLDEASLGEPLRACVVHVDKHRASGAPKGVKPFVAQVSEAVLADDPQLALGQKLLLRELGRLPDEDATKTLIELASDPRTSPALLADARDELAQRRTGEHFLEAALARHFDFLSGAVHPPVAPMARAIATMKDSAAAGVLVEHLFDPADTGEDLREAAAALAVVARADQMPALRRFFGMYRASASDDDTTAAVVAVAKAMLTVGGSEGVKIVEDAANDANTAPDARQRLDELLSSPGEGVGDGGAHEAGAL